MKEKQKKIAVINDLSGYGRCSLTVAIPILSAMKLQCCPVPTSILSNHTGYPTYYFDDYTERMVSYIDGWKQLDLEFDGILTGFLGSQEQISIVLDFIQHFKGENTVTIVDPIMGDHGKAYATYTPSMCQAMSRLVSAADVVTPNLTEACILTETPYREKGWKQRELEELLAGVLKLGPKKAVITGIKQGGFLANLAGEQGGTCQWIRAKRVGTERPGTGDVFSSIVAAEAVYGRDLSESVKKASKFIQACILESEERQVPVRDGVCFEELLGRLIPRQDMKGVAER